MKKQSIFLGNSKIMAEQKKVSGGFTEIEGEKYYRIENYHEMPDFFISIVSSDDHWMFISSNGSLTAGRKNRDNALFPYYTVDKIHDYKSRTGSKTSLLVSDNQKTFLWKPFSDASKKIYNITRNLYKSFYGNKLIYEEINHDLDLTFRYSWNNSKKYGFIRKSFLTNSGDKTLEIEFLDGIINILPPGTGYAFQNEYSNLLDAYKKNERIPDSTLCLYTLSSVPVDRAEPSEALRANTVWSAGIPVNSDILLSETQTESFIKGQALKPEEEIRAKRGAYLINSRIKLNAKQSVSWYIIADINKDSRDVINLKNRINNNPDLQEILESEISTGTEKLAELVSSADGLQQSATDICNARHYSNTMYNIMRGGVFINNYTIETDDFRSYLLQINKMVGKEHHQWLESLPPKLTYQELTRLAGETQNADLLRICYEYLPLTFSRRHGDPSRPWNIFSIETRNPDGSIKFNYEGNWRDIFQNWEALAYSFPGFIEGMIIKFLNASTIDGYNPYRITRNGIDWESPDPDDPWAYIGYWGDHQIIYLQKLLEVSEKFYPGELDNLLEQNIFTYANVPYRIKPYDEIVRNPKETVVFDHTLNNRIINEAALLGADAKLLKEKGTDQVYKVSLAEKILVSLLSKLSNFIPEAGIWLNTQRPEWNDANNALVGNGTSMVTLYYLRRFMFFWKGLLEKSFLREVNISEEVASLFEETGDFLKENSGLVNTGFSDEDRRRFANQLGSLHSGYRNEIYNYSFSGIKRTIRTDSILAFLDIALRYTDHSVRINKRNDGLYHAYNLISIGKKTISIRHLYEMLEGQVAVLSSGLLSPKESLEVLDSLKNSKMFRPDQYSYTLYPDRQLPNFQQKNIIPDEEVEKSPLLLKLLEDQEETIITRDVEKQYHFNSEFRNSHELEKALNQLRIGNYSSLIENEKDNILGIYEKIFDHLSFTGRSGTFFGYEGLGSIYWHMVSKLLLACQEAFFKSVDEGADKTICGKLKDHYYEIKAGIGLYKSPDLYGAFPMDAYSHTPAGAGVKQPGLTGQVKEDVISRFGELGLRISEGTLFFDISLLNHTELLEKETEYVYYNTENKKCTFSLKPDQIAFTLCQLPFIYSSSENDQIIIIYKNGQTEITKGHRLDKQKSEMIFNRNHSIKYIEVTFKNLLS